MDKPLRKTEVAERCRVSTETVGTWIESGALKATDVRPYGSGRARWIIQEEDLDAFLRTRTSTTIKAAPKGSRRKRHV